jgi:uncharacterized protein
LRPENIDDRLYLKAQGEMGLALLLVHEATAEPRYLDSARGIAKAMTALEDEKAGGFFATTRRATDALVARDKPLLDNATAARFLGRLGAVTREQAYVKTAERTLAATVRSGDLRNEGPWGVGLAALVYEELLLGPVEITVVRGEDETRARALHDEAVRIYEPRKLVRLEDPGHYPKPKDAAAVYVCTRSACSSAMRDIAEVHAAVDRMTVAGPDAPCAP